MRALRKGRRNRGFPEPEAARPVDEKKEAARPVDVKDEEAAAVVAATAPAVDVAPLELAAVQQEDIPADAEVATEARTVSNPVVAVA